MVKVEIIKPTVGTIALSHGLGILIAPKYNPIAKYVKSANKIRRAQLLSQALSASTFSFLASIFCNLSSRVSMLLLLANFK